MELTYNLIVLARGRAMAQAVSHQPLNMEA
jgi:hypothetical protein